VQVLELKKLEKILVSDVVMSKEKI